LTAFDRAQRFIGIKELDGTQHHPLIQWWLYLCGYATDSPDEIPWCSAFVNGVHWDCNLPRSKSAAARSWLRVGSEVDLADARVGDVVILKRGAGSQPGPEVVNAPGHVGFFAGWKEARPNETNDLLLLGGNQSDSVSLQSFPQSKVLGVRRVA
jgi:uncharacterized protein (TIGR02594 family)